MIKDKNDNIVLTNILNLMNAKGVRQKDLADYLGISPNAITQWKIHKTKSYMKYIDQLSIYFDVKPDDILHSQKMDCANLNLTLREQKIIKSYRSFSEKTKTEIDNLFSLFTELECQNQS